LNFCIHCFCIAFFLVCCPVYRQFWPSIFLHHTLTYSSLCYLYFALVCCLTVPILLHSTPRVRAKCKLPAVGLHRFRYRKINVSK
jgi:hypothetical protein